MKLLMHGIPAVVFLFVLTNFAHMHSMTFCSGDSGGGGGDKFLSSGDGPMPHGGDKGGGATVLSSGNGGAMELSSGGGDATRLRGGEEKLLHFGEKPSEIVNTVNISIYYVCGHWFVSSSYIQCWIWCYVSVP